MSEWNFADVWETVARVQPTAECLVQRGIRRTWAEFDYRAEAVATSLLQHGVGHQGKVAQLLYSCPEYLESVYACFKASFVPVNTNFRYKSGELAQLWDDADVEAVVFHQSLADRIEPVRRQLGQISCWLCVDDVGADPPRWALPYEAIAADRGPAVSPPWSRSPDDLILLYTGGTTGRSKGVMWRHDDLFVVQNRTAEVRYPEDEGPGAIGRTLARRRHPPPRLVPCAPLAHGIGAFTAYSVLDSGGTVILLRERGFDPYELLDVIERERVTQLSIVGDAFSRPIVAALDAHPGRWNLSSLWLVVSAGMVWTDQSKADLLSHLPDVLCVDSLGSSEAVGMAQSRTTSGQQAPRDEAVGIRFSIGPNTRVVDEDGVDVLPGSGRAGHIILGDRMPLGYYKDPEATRSTFRTIDGRRWSAPGDMATVQGDGTIRLIGRSSLVVNTGGEKVFVEEVEELLRKDPTVADAGVVGLPDDRFGHVVVAAVQAAPGRTVDVHHLRETVRANLAGYKVPKRIVVLEHIGRGPNGKLDYRWLRDALVEGADQSPDATGDATAG